MAKNKNRREGREAAVQFLYQIDLMGEKAPESSQIFWKLRGFVGAKKQATSKSRTFAEELVNGVMTHREDIDERIKKYTAHYEMERLGVVDRNILRMAVFEMIHSLEIPPVVIINEAIEVAKKYGSDQSGSFVNGVLDQLKNDLGRPAREPAVPRKKKPAPPAAQAKK
jgi:N utilization substance protein B